MHIRIEALSLRDFRCHAHGDWRFSSAVTVIHGDNGCGKTSVLEAIALMAHGRSFRQGRDPVLARWQCDRFSIEGVWRRYGPLRIVLRGERRRVRVYMQGKQLPRRKELMELLPLVVDAPQGRPLIDGVSAERRRWLDALLARCDANVQASQRAYLRALMQRTRLLRHSPQTEELDAWEAQMVLHGARWRAARASLCGILNQALAKELPFTEEEIHLRFSEEVDVSAQQWRQHLAEGRMEDRRIGRCRVGPHADRLQILRAGREIRHTASRGQQRLATVALRLAECWARRKARGSWPLLLLDDAFDALDARRRGRLLQRLLHYPGQVLLTAPDDISLTIDDERLRVLSLADRGRN